ncbi:hypothetical protein FOPG_18856 [Fusarium oxysporum f. sp. conglutinans race 2 54008]|uniref:Uncharacterized protein n=3 Tax=Fusarium oxysporum f. sp. conglutinans TaxID=100902 RepID=A0A8H6GCZ2_FUSOX|nr:hypothetical protein FOPG_18856 [Fusarium oxysporum f. sp. conglutinans race 2 54008]KAF6515833.1 hypothetical protein HZS61_004574 [Fusarium oxysporum f. sp. conglutinans]KAH7464224.1 hypothetical protein FOMA001_g17815 [Fusarium oxysporum f. sp. matthiolae]KAI8402258.1 hypothetical protein FOFC_17564 [Fusarium oxysporum]
MVSFKIFVTSLLAVSASAIPLKSDASEKPKPSLDKTYKTHEAVNLTISYNNDGNEKREAASKDDELDKRCVWNDGHGDIACGFFSVVLGREYVTIKGNGWRVHGKVDCSGGGDKWKSFTSPLPLTVDIHAGNACINDDYSGNYDNTWIKYAKEYLDAPSDTRCGAVGDYNAFRRCIIPI